MAHEVRSDLDALQRGRASVTPAEGMKLYTTGFEGVSLRDFYRGRSAFLLCSGPSLVEHDLSQLHRRGILTMGVNNAWAVFRPDLWLCVDHPGRFLDVGWKDPGVLKFAPIANRDTRLRVQRAGGSIAHSAFCVRDMPSVLLYLRTERFDHKRWARLDQMTGLCWGCHNDTTDSLGIKGKRSCMLAAIHLLYYLGVRRLALVGADFRMDPARPYAFDERRNAASVRHNTALYRALDQRLAALRPELERAGMVITNCTPGSGLTAFDHEPFDEAVERAGRECAKPFTTAGWYTDLPEPAARAGAVAR